MFPDLFHLGPIPIHTYGFLIAIGFLISVQVVRRLAPISKINPDRLVDLTFWCLLVGFLGARILFIITRWDSFMNDPISIFKVWEGGLVFLGGPIAVVPFLIGYVRKYKMPLWKVLDICSIGLVIAHAFGRLGCLMAGCCYGKPTGTSFGIRLYSDLVDKQLQGVLLHPTQIYESVSLFILFFGLLYVFKRKSFDGQVVLTYFMAYPVIRSIIEIYRGDLIRGFVIEDVLSTSQFLSIIIFIIALIALMIRLEQVRRTSPGKKATSRR
jgi:phosphatidylglycerol---prolipoprotein diacylglyceryl transferase